jgi:hypothetical protein
VSERPNEAEARNACLLHVVTLVNAARNAKSHQPDETQSAESPFARDQYYQNTQHGLATAARGKPSSSSDSESEIWLPQIQSDARSWVELCRRLPQSLYAALEAIQVFARAWEVTDEERVPEACERAARHVQNLHDCTPFSIPPI